jgi:hypothetical protein
MHIKLGDRFRNFLKLTFVLVLDVLEFNPFWKVFFFKEHVQHVKHTVLLVGIIFLMDADQRLVLKENNS